MYILLISRGIPEKKAPQWGCFEYDQAKALHKAGHKVVVFSVDQRFRINITQLGIHRTEKDGITAYNNIVLPKAVTSLSGKTANERYVAKQWRKLYKTILEQEGKPDIIYAHYLFNIYRATNYLQTDIPIVGIEHWSEIKKNVLPAYIQRMAEQSYSRVDKLISVSEATRQTIKTQFNVDSLVVNDMVGEEFVSQEIPTKSSTHDTVRFIAVGSLIKRKGFDLLISAFAKADLPEGSWSLQIIGNGEERQQLEKQIETLHLTNNITIIGQQNKDDIIRLLNLSDVFALPSRMETFGVVYIEALALGLPVIATPCGGPEEFISRHNGLLVAIDDIDELAKALKYMHAHHSEYDRQVIADKCRSRFSPEVIAAQLTRIFADIIRDKQ